ncbi:MAG: hypothetical protein ACR2JB_09245 [Bryobacteraceae bacterium]
MANRAAHGEYVSPDSAERLTVLGERLLRELRSVYEDNITEPSKTLVIGRDYLDQLESAHYRVITAVPLVQNPYMCLRILNQEGLDNLLEGYEEYAEFLVSITPLDLNLPEALMIATEK